MTQKIRDFFWLCSGADKKILLDCPTEASKYVGIGATVLFTGIFASLAGFYAAYTVFENLFSSALIGLIWGAMIFNLDRYIVSSMRKTKKPVQEWKMAIPRIILALMIAIVISKPLEMRVFDKEIQAELSLMEQEFNINKENLIKSRFIPSIDALRNEIEILKQEITDKTQTRDNLRMLAQQEADGTGGTLRRNAGPIYRIKKADADQVEQELLTLTAVNNNQINEKLKKIEILNRDLDREINGGKEITIDGLASRMEALNRLTVSSAAIRVANWFIILLFIAIETAPVLVKLISTRGPYDYRLQSEEYDHKVTGLENMAKSNARVKKRMSKLPAVEKDFITGRLDLEINNI